MEYVQLFFRKLFFLLFHISLSSAFHSDLITNTIDVDEFFSLFHSFLKYNCFVKCIVNYSCFFLNASAVEDGGDEFQENSLAKK